MGGVLLVVSASLPDGLVARAGPRKDYALLAQALNATILDRSCTARSRIARLLCRALGVATAQAWIAFRRREEFRAIVTDGEHIGLPLALLLKLARAKTPHVTVGHRLSAPKKRPLFRWLKAHTHIARIALHSRQQHTFAARALRIPLDQLALVPYQVDTQFWSPQTSIQEDHRLLCSAGLEFRDYPTLFQAVEDLNVKVVVGAASHWSRRPNTAAGRPPPANVEVAAYDYFALRELYARAAIVVVPLDDVDFQAGVTTILEAMAMAKPVIVTHTRGQTDVVEDRRRLTRGPQPSPRPLSLARIVADTLGEPLEPNGFYVPPGDPAAMRRAIIYLLEHPSERARLGAAGRLMVERLMTVEHFADRMRQLVENACADVQRSSGQSRTLVGEVVRTERYAWPS